MNDRGCFTPLFSQRALRETDSLEPFLLTPLLVFNYCKRVFISHYTNNRNQATPQTMLLVWVGFDSEFLMTEHQQRRKIGTGCSVKCNFRYVNCIKIQAKPNTFTL
jgi:hypothetical protein